jgi:hypothetical protein
LEIAPHASLVPRGRARIGLVEQRVRLGKHQVLLVLVTFLLPSAALVFAA